MVLRWAKRAGAAFAVAALIAAPAAAETSYVRAGRLIDTERGTVLTDRLIRIDDGRVTSVTAYAPPPAGAVVTDWSAYTVLPGLIDMHTHLSDWARPTMSPSRCCTARRRWPMSACATPRRR